MTNTFLLNDFYTIESSTKTDDSLINAVIKLNADHNIFKGHFEQMPVVPGVCQAQIIKEILQRETGKSFSLTIGNNIKFTGMIIPTQNAIVNIELTYKEVENQHVVDAKLFFADVTFTKFKGTFIQN